MLQGVRMVKALVAAVVPMVTAGDAVVMGSDGPVTASATCLQAGYASRISAFR